MKLIRFQMTGLVAGIAAFALMFLVPAAFAHARPVAMTAAPDQTISAPDAVKITFSEAVEPKFTKISGHGATKEAPIVGTDAKTITIKLTQLAAGVYIVKWVAVVADTHRANSYKFTVK